MRGEFGESKTCKLCSCAFTIDVTQKEFLEQVSPKFGTRTFLIPSPSLCPSCRLLRRLAYRNQIYVTSFTEVRTGKMVFSMFPQDAPFPVIPNAAWWDEQGWNPLAYARDFDFSGTFFEQWRELRNLVQRPYVNAVLAENSDYCNNVGWSKNCYFVFDAGSIEDSLYLESCVSCKDCVDCSLLADCQLCYDCVNCVRCYQLQSSDHSTDCSASYFLSNCRSCKHCCGCINLRQREYCIFNEQKDRDEYMGFLEKLPLDSLAGRDHLARQVENFYRGHPRPHLYGSRVESCSGNHLHNVKNVYDSFVCHETEDVRFGFLLSQHVKSCQDFTIWGQGAELIYECVVCGDNIFRLAFCNNCWSGASELLYCDSCHGSRSCFGCVSLRKREYCILNKQYTKDAYFETVERILHHMQQTGEWGEFFPATHSHVPYNWTLAQRYAPLTKEACENKSLWWAEQPRISRSDGVAARLLPDEVPASDASIIALSAKSNRPFKIIAEELKRYRQLRVPLPKLSYDERMEDRMRRAGGITLNSRCCDKTGAAILTAHPLDASYPVWEREVLEQNLL